MLWLLAEFESSIFGSSDGSYYLVLGFAVHHRNGSPVQFVRSWLATHGQRYLLAAVPRWVPSQLGSSRSVSGMLTGRRTAASPLHFAMLGPLPPLHWRVPTYLAYNWVVQGGCLVRPCYPSPTVTSARVTRLDRRIHSTDLRVVWRPSWVLTSMVASSTRFINRLTLTLSPTARSNSVSAGSYHKRWLAIVWCPSPVGYDWHIDGICTSHFYSHFNYQLSTTGPVLCKRHSRITTYWV